MGNVQFDQSSGTEPFKKSLVMEENEKSDLKCLEINARSDIPCNNEIEGKSDQKMMDKVECVDRFANTNESPIEKRRKKCRLYKLVNFLALLKVIAMKVLLMFLVFMIRLLAMKNINKLLPLVSFLFPDFFV